MREQFETIAVPNPAACAELRNEVIFRPAVDIYETPEEVVLRANTPGATPAEIEVRFEDSTLEIVAPVKAAKPTSIRYLAREYGVGSYRRSFVVQQRIDSSRIVADYVNGVLTVTLPKAEDSRPRKIAVRAAA